MTVDVAALAAAVRAGERPALAQAITLVESTRDDHRADATELMQQLLPATGKAVRIGVSGPPGVGKSSIIEALGVHVIATGLRVAVLAVDPSSPRSGGSILGDKTRMERLGREDAAYIRPSPSGTTAGGVARRTREAMLLCEASGFDVVIVETVGSGQSDVAVADLVDVFVLLVQPSSGDELQGIKRGVMELADLVVVTKADGELADAAQRTAADHRVALSLLHHDAPPTVVTSSTQTDAGVAPVWHAITEVQRSLAADGRLAARRRSQARRLLWAEIKETLIDDLMNDEQVARLAPEIEAAVVAGTMAPRAGARRLLDAQETT